ncbi:thermonuclease family protein [Terasakiella sp.]|uniref:thermonuclease family protein n=1 Tax=Terasakiella sp. TaxID=2034861 RepID=UPI003AA7CF9B
MFLLLSIPSKAEEPRIIDGDTLILNGTRIRLHGIDAPESKQRCWKKGDWWKCGQAATDFLRSLVRDRDVTCQPITQDRYKRTVAKCFAGELDISRSVVRAGYALAYRRYSKEYVEAENAAKEEQQGLWAGDFLPPWEWRKAKHQY